MCEICLKLTIKTLERRYSLPSENIRKRYGFLMFSGVRERRFIGVFIVNFEHISHHGLVFLL